MMTTAPASILVVDDEPDTCANLSDILGDQGYRVDVAYDGPSALELVKNNAYDLALLDLKMPGMDGLELYRRIKKLRSGTVAIIVTAYASSETAKAVFDAGAWQILSKPVEFSRLLALVDEALGQPLVMIVDDDPDLCDTLWDVLREQGFRVCIAHTIAEAEERLIAKSYQVLLIDMKLPTGSGRDVLHLVQQSDPAARTVLITGHRVEMEQSVEQALAEGADAACYKPFDVEHLLRTVKQLAE